MQLESMEATINIILRGTPTIISSLTTFQTEFGKITPEEHPFFDKLKPCKAIDHIPLWKKAEKNTPAVQSKTVPEYPVRISLEQDTSEEVVLDAEDAAEDMKISYTDAQNYIYKQETPDKV